MREICDQMSDCQLLRKLLSWVPPPC